MTDPVHAQIVHPARYRPLHARARVVGSDVATIARVTRSVVAHDRTRAVARNLAYIPGGCAVVFTHWRETHTNARYERMIRAGEATGNWEEVKEWEARAELARDRRHKRVMNWITAPKELVKAFALLLFVLVVLLLALGGMAYWVSGGEVSALGPIRVAAAAIAWIVWLVAIGGTQILLGLPALFILALWWTGKRAGASPAFLAPATERAGGDEITPHRVVIAFRELGLAPLKTAIKAMGDSGAGMLSQIRPAGCGVEIDVTLPEGVSTEEILRRRRKLAENLGRHEYEVFPSVAPRPRTVRVWAADSGALDEPVGTSPLVYDDQMKADYRRGKAPWGVSLRGDQVHVSLFQVHTLIAGMSNQGKTKNARALALWLALDKTVEFRIADLKGMNDKTKQSDWEMFRGIATKFIAGPSDEHVIEAVEMLEAASAEMKRRLTEGGHWDPLIVICDEVQAMYMCPAKDAGGRHYGGSKSTSRGLTAVREIQNQGRVVDVLLWQGTQDPSNQNFPVLARNGIHLRVATALATESQARMVLQDKAVDKGAAPDKLRMGKDRGTVVVAGDGAPVADDEVSITVRSYYIDDEQAHEIADRAKALRGPVKVLDPDEVRDLLNDVHEAFGEDDKVRAAHLADRLRETFHHYRPYRNLNGTGLVGLLAEVGVIVEPGQGRHFNVQAARVLRAIDERDGVYE